MIRVVTFDIDDTLYDFSTLSRRALDHVSACARGRLGAAVEGIDLDMLITNLETTAEEMEHSYARLDELRRSAFARTLARFGVTDAALVEEMRRTYLQHRFAKAEPYRDTRAVLKELAEKYTLGVISNGEQDLQILGLHDVIGFVVLASDLGFQKPDPRIFRHAMSVTGCAPKEMAHVGDSLRSDVVGAQEAGAWGIWFNPLEASPHEEIVPHAEIRELTELPAVLERISATPEST